MLAKRKEWSEELFQEREYILKQCQLFWCSSESVRQNTPRSRDSREQQEENLAFTEELSIPFATRIFLCPYHLECWILIHHKDTSLSFCSGSLLHLMLRFAFDTYVYMCVLVWLLSHCVPMPMDARRGSQTPRAGVIGHYEPPDKGAGNWTQALWKTSKHF